MHYQVVFDVAQTGYRQWGALGIAAWFCLYPVAYWRFHERLRNPDARRFCRFLVFISLWCVLMSLFSFGWFYPNYYRLQAALRHSQCEVTTGVVTQWRPLFKWSKAGPGESFVVNGHAFGYRDGSAQNGFHHTGVIHNGQSVRIYYLGEDIARLEIAR